mmetsp:Transcript_119115/g.336949  ORF Transcript_119115/g.336949 Transcript_119115/m.336949 type:complete len:940 (-) Transcript_119115:13-2832(-)
MGWLGDGRDCCFPSIESIFNHAWNPVKGKSAPHRSQTHQLKDRYQPKVLATQKSIVDVLLPRSACQQLFTGASTPRLVLQPGAESVYVECSDVMHAAWCGGVSSNAQYGCLVLTDLRLVFVPSHRPWEQTLGRVFARVDEDDYEHELTDILGPGADVQCVLEHLWKDHGLAATSDRVEAAIRPNCSAEERHMQRLAAGIVQLELGCIDDVYRVEAPSVMLEGNSLQDLEVKILTKKSSTQTACRSERSFVEEARSRHAGNSEDMDTDASLIMDRSRSPALCQTVVYSVAVHLQQENWIVEHTFAEFRALHNDLGHFFETLPRFPPRFRLGTCGFEPERRQAQLSEYMRELLLVEDIFSATPLLRFLCISEQWAARKQARRLEASDALIDLMDSLTADTPTWSATPTSNLTAALGAKRASSDAELECRGGRSLRRLQSSTSGLPSHCTDALVTVGLQIRTLSGELLRFHVRSGDAEELCERLIKDIKALARDQHERAARIFGRQELREPGVFPPFSLTEEYERMGITSGSGWRLSSCNASYGLAATYPSVVACPEDASDELLMDAAGVRSKRRLPVLTWRHPVHGAPLCRSSQPRSGLKMKPFDEELLELIRLTAPNPVLHIVDARSWLAATGNALRGGGSERLDPMSSLGNGQVRISFLGIDNIHEMRASLDRFCWACTSNRTNFLKLVADSRWLDHQVELLRGATLVANCLQLGQAVLVHCSDGWDRTAQIVSLAQLILDPYYRTLKGFAALVEKDWCAFGHGFRQRSSHGRGRSPVFFQWLECVWQMAQQHPTAFEFSDDFLALTSSAMYARWFDTFAGDCERERRLSGSLNFWSYAEYHLTKEVLYRPMFTRSAFRVEELAIVAAMHSLSFWPVHTRNKPGNRSLRARLSEYEASVRSLRGENDELRNEVQELESQLALNAARVQELERQLGLVAT